MRKQRLHDNIILKRQSICKISFSENIQSPAIHQRVQLPKKDNQFSTYLKNRILKLKSEQEKFERVRKKSIKLYQPTNAKSPHDIFTDNQGKRLLSEISDTHQLDLRKLEFRSKSHEKNPFFLQIHGTSSLIKRCHLLRFNTDVDRTPSTHTPARRQFTPQKKRARPKLDYWKELNGWQVLEDTNNNNYFF